MIFKWATNVAIRPALGQQRGVNLDSFWRVHWSLKADDGRPETGERAYLVQEIQHTYEVVRNGDDLNDASRWLTDEEIFEALFPTRPLQPFHFWEAWENTGHNSWTDPAVNHDDWGIGVLDIQNTHGPTKGRARIDGTAFVIPSPNFELEELGFGSWYVAMAGKLRATIADPQLPLPQLASLIARRSLVIEWDWCDNVSNGTRVISYDGAL